LVSITASQSSSFMRMASWSRVMPALFTSTCRPPSLRTICSMSASDWAASVTFSTSPRLPGNAASASLTAAAPASEVAVPMTRWPCSASASAMARPMPREAPVTRATRTAAAASGEDVVALMPASP
jgi:hypothetical protein